MFAGTRFGILSIIIVLTTFIILPTMSQEAQNRKCTCNPHKANLPKNVAECEKERMCYKSSPQCDKFIGTDSCAYSVSRKLCLDNMREIWLEHHGGESKLRSKNDTSSVVKINYLCEDLNDENEDTKKFFKDVEGCKPMYDGGLRLCEKLGPSKKIDIETLRENDVLGSNSLKPDSFQSIYSAIAIMTAYLMI